ncbi:MAG: sel1 repeat family protein, partial [Deltaproteobacteria bacterium]|nr:sel1 repeat family protein [Deltaproteobacteria bacterium]
LYYHGEGLKKDLNEALSYSLLAANQGHDGARLFLAMLFLKADPVKADDFDKAVEYIELVADKGNATAQYILGQLHYDGHLGYKGLSLKKDLVEAIKYFQLAAEQNHDQALLALGKAYFEGRGLKKDDLQAANYFRRSAALGNPEAKKRLASLERKTLH